VLYKPPDQDILELGKDQVDILGMHHLVTSLRISPSLVREAPDWLREKLPAPRESSGIKPERDPRTIRKNIIGKPEKPVPDASLSTMVDDLLMSGFVPVRLYAYIKKMAGGQPSYQVNIKWMRPRRASDTEVDFEYRHQVLGLLRDWFRQYSWNLWVKEYKSPTEADPSLVINLNGWKNTPPSMRHRKLRVEESILYLC
jgi:hypothetical protein